MTVLDGYLGGSALTATFAWSGAYRRGVNRSSAVGAELGIRSSLLPTNSDLMNGVLNCHTGSRARCQASRAIVNYSVLISNGHRILAFPVGSYWIATRLKAKFNSTGRR